MKGKKDSKKIEAEGSGKTHMDVPTEQEEYAYRTSGIRERSGSVPLWLIIVATFLICWGVWYTIQNWSPPLSHY